MTPSQSIEGIWEDLIKDYSEELTGQRVKITLLAEEKSQRLHKVLADILEEADALDVQKPDLPDKKQDGYGNIILEKYRKQGLNL